MRLGGGRLCRHWASGAEGRRMSPARQDQLKLQAERVLEEIQVLNENYGALLAERDPELRQALSAAAAALQRATRGSQAKSYAVKAIESARPVSLRAST